jgi:NAD(P)-dependent dehydrogenase (short-subunit alcohol dehydrogenase family)
VRSDAIVHSHFSGTDEEAGSCEEKVMHTPVTRGKAILVTGCSSGIGRATAVYLAHTGYTVFATVRKEADASALRLLGEPDLVPVWPLDLRNGEHIAAAVRAVEDELQRRNLPGLYGLVNNAGGGVVAPLELLAPEQLRDEFETRVLGPLALLQGVLPFIRQSNGRIVWITTPALMPIPFVSSIHVPDFAVNGLVRTLSLELKHWRIPAIMIRCGIIQTAAPERTARALQAAIHAWPPERLALYREDLDEQQAELGGFDARRTAPEEVARVVAEALSSARPRSRYRVGTMAGLAALLELLPQTTVDLIMTLRGSASRRRHVGNEPARPVHDI